MRIGLDLDGVIADARAETQHRFLKDHGAEEWDRVKDYFHTSKAPGVPEGWMRAQFDDPTYWLNIKPFQDGWLMANKWFSQGHDVLIVTARYAEERHLTEQWLEDWDIIVSDVIFSPLGQKHEVASEEGLQIFVEDNPDEAATVADHVGASFLVDAPYNQCETDHRVVRVASLYQVDKVIERCLMSNSSVKDVASIDTFQISLETTPIERTLNLT